MQNVRFSTKLRIQGIEECGKGTELHGGGTPHRKNVNWEGGTQHIKFGHMFILGWGHRSKFQTLAVGRVGGWSGSSKNNATPWLHLARKNLHFSQFCCESKM